MGSDMILRSLVEADITRRRILFANWKKAFALPFVQSLIARLDGLQSETNYSREIKFAFPRSLCSQRSIPPRPLRNCGPSCRHCSTKKTDTKGAREMTRAAIPSLRGQEYKSIVSAARDFVLQTWREGDDYMLRKDFEFVRSINSPESQQLLREGVEQELETIRSEIQLPTERTAQRVTLCLDYRESLEEEALDKTLIEALDAGSAETLKIWLGTIDRTKARLGPDFFNRFATRCLEIVPSIPESSESQELLLQAFVDVLPKLSPTERGLAIQRYFSHMKDPEPGTRLAAASKLKEVRDAACDSQDFKLAVASVIKYLRDEVKTSELFEYQSVFDALLSQGSLLGEYQNRDLAEMAKALMLQTDGSFQELGLRLVEQMPVIPNDDQAEIIHLLIGLTRSSPDLKERSSARLSLFSLANLDEGARQELTDWRQSNGSLG